MPIEVLTRLRRAAAICFGLAIIVGSLTDMPGPALLGDKLQHLLSYAGWALLVSASPRPLPRIGLYGAILLLVGGAIELVQPAFGREASLLDFLANLLGIAFGTAAGLFLRARLYGADALSRRAA